MGKLSLRHPKRKQAEVQGAGGELRREVRVGRKCDQRLSWFSTPPAHELRTNSQPGPNPRNSDLLAWARAGHQ